MSSQPANSARCILVRECTRQNDKADAREASGEEEQQNRCSRGCEQMLPLPAASLTILAQEEGKCDRHVAVRRNRRIRLKITGESTEEQLT